MAPPVSRLRVKIVTILDRSDVILEGMLRNPGAGCPFKTGSRNSCESAELAETAANCYRVAEQSSREPIFRMRTRRDAALRSLRLMLAASVVFPLLLFCYASWANYHAAFERADEQIRQALDLSAEQALRVFRSISVTFDSVEQITRGRTEQTHPHQRGRAERAAQAVRQRAARYRIGLDPERAGRRDRILAVLPASARRERARARLSEGPAGKRMRAAHRRGAAHPADGRS